MSAGQFAYTKIRIRCKIIIKINGQIYVSVRALQKNASNDVIFAHVPRTVEVWEYM